MTDIKLKSCPFCGGEAEFKVISNFGAKMVTVHCNGCNTESDNVQESVDYCAKQVAAEKWNRRDG